jgi:hypothetical protein
MASYPVTFTTNRGPQSATFQLEADSSLGIQIGQVIEELALQGQIIRGGPEDELAVYWNGTELDTTKSLRALGVSPTRPLELRMRARAPVSHHFVAESYFPKASYVAMLLGFTGGLVAWLIGLTISDVGDMLPTYRALDLVIAVALGACIGAPLAGFEAYRRFRGPLPRALLGLLLGALGAAVGAIIALVIHDRLGSDATFRQSLGLRVLAWLIVAIAITSTLLLALPRRRAVHTWLALLTAAVAGALSGIVFNFPGPTALWQGVGFGLVGAAIGFGLIGLPLGAARALVEVEALERRAVGLLGARGLALPVDAQMVLHSRSQRGDGAESAVVRFDGRRVAVQPRTRRDGTSSGGVRVGGDVIQGTVLLGDGEAIDVGTTRYRLHVIGAAVRT